MRHDFALQLPKEYGRANCELLCVDLRAFGFRGAIEEKRNAKQELEEFVVFLAMDDHERIIEEAEVQLLKQ